MMSLLLKQRDVCIRMRHSSSGPRIPGKYMWKILSIVLWWFYQKNVVVDTLCAEFSAVPPLPQDGSML